MFIIYCCEGEFSNGRCWLQITSPLATDDVIATRELGCAKHTRDTAKVYNAPYQLLLRSFLSGISAKMACLCAVFSAASLAIHCRDRTIDHLRITCDNFAAGWILY